METNADSSSRLECGSISSFLFSIIDSKKPLKSRDSDSDSAMMSMIQENDVPEWFHESELFLHQVSTCAWTPTSIIRLYRHTILPALEHHLNSQDLVSEILQHMFRTLREFRYDREVQESLVELLFKLVVTLEQAPNLREEDGHGRHLERLLVNILELHGPASQLIQDKGQLVLDRLSCQLAKAGVETTGPESKASSISRHQIQQPFPLRRRVLDPSPQVSSIRREASAKIVPARKYIPPSESNHRKSHLSTRRPMPELTSHFGLVATTDRPETAPSSLLLLDEDSPWRRSTGNSNHRRRTSESPTMMGKIQQAQRRIKLAYDQPIVFVEPSSLSDRLQAQDTNFRPITAPNSSSPVNNNVKKKTLFKPEIRAWKTKSFHERLLSSPLRSKQSSLPVLFRHAKTTRGGESGDQLSTQLSTQRSPTPPHAPSTVTNGHLPGVYSPEQVEALVTIQHHARGFLARKELASRQIRHRAVVCIQRHVRGHQGRRRHVKARDRAFVQMKYAQGLANQREGKTHLAMEAYAQALQVAGKGKFASIHVNLGSACMSISQYTQAITHFEEALEIQPTNVKARYNLGLAYYELHLFPLARVQVWLRLRDSPQFGRDIYLTLFS